jgi:hypothetical protein
MFRNETGVTLFVIWALFGFVMTRSVHWLSDLTDINGISHTQAPLIKRKDYVDLV